jgi:hypothetical protein
MPSIDYCRTQQLRCAELYHDPGARLGLYDWFAEEMLMTYERLFAGEEIRAALSDPAIRADILDLVTREVAPWAWPAKYIKIAAVDVWAEEVRRCE